MKVEIFLRAFYYILTGDKVWDIDKINIFYPGHFFKKRQDNAGSPLASFQFDR